MSTGHTQYKLSKKDMEKIEKSGKQGDRNNQPVKKKKGVVSIILYVLFGLIAAAYFVLLLFGKSFLPEVYSNSLNPFYGHDNIIPVVRSVSYGILILTVSIVARFFIEKEAARRTAQKKSGIALIELLGNLIKYVSYLVVVFIILTAAGVNTTELLAGLGIVTLIIGLGVTSLIEDIVAGFFIIAEHLFEVGDIIVLDGFRGTVLSIGIRSTKVLDIGNDVLTIRNSSIGSLVNLTNRQSAAAVTIPLAPDESIERVEQVVAAAHMEYMEEKYPQLIGPPLYLGICEITPKGVQNLLLVGGCKEEHKYDIERALLREFKVLFERNGIKLGYNYPEE